MAIDPWEMAAECNQALQGCSDEDRELILVNLRDLWISIGNERAGGALDWDWHVERVAVLHADIIGQTQTPPQFTPVDLASPEAPLAPELGARH